MYQLVWLLGVHVMGTYSMQIEPSCSPTDSFCQFQFSISHHWTMMRYTSSGMMLPVVLEDDGTFWSKRKNCSGRDMLSANESEHVVTGDGSYVNSILINGQLPGPSIVVYAGQQVVVNVSNELVNEVVTIHWHGLHQRLTPWMDGTGKISHCPIKPGETFIYRFIADPAGTHWYHAHTGTQLAKGAYGAFVVLDMPRASNGKIGDYEEEFVFIVSDWMRGDSDVKLPGESPSIPREFEEGLCYSSPRQPDGLAAGTTPWVSGVINGKGRHYPNATDTPEMKIPLEWFPVHRATGKLYKFRLISAAMERALRVSIDQHTLYVVALDGMEVETRVVDYIIVNGGERVDFYIDARDAALASNYWIRAQTMEVYQDKQIIKPGHTEAVLHYVNDPEIEPTTEPRVCTRTEPCHVLNCPFQHYPAEMYMECVSITALKGKRNQPVLQPDTQDMFTEMFLSFHLTEDHAYGIYKPNINGHVHIPPVSPPQLYPTNPGYTPCLEEQCGSDVCYCTHQLDLPKGHIIQLVLFVHLPHTEDGEVTGRAHTVHLHGHHFQVVKVGWPSYNTSTNFILDNSPDIECATSLESCGQARWRNPQWGSGNLPGMVEGSPVLKDTVNVPGGGYVVVRLLTDNPGYWLMESHTGVLDEQGMAVIIKEGGLEDMTVPPSEIPLCGNFDWDSQDFLEAVRNPQANEASPEDIIDCAGEEYKYKLAVMGLGPTAVLLSLSALLLYLLNQPRNYNLGPNKASPRKVRAKGPAAKEGTPLLSE